MADQYNSAHTGAEIDQAVSDVQNNQSAWNGKVSAATLNARLNRTTNVNAADTNYTAYMARGESLNATEVTPSVNGCIAWVYG